MNDCPHVDYARWQGIADARSQAIRAELCRVMEDELAWIIFMPDDCLKLFKRFYRKNRKCPTCVAFVTLGKRA